MPNRAPSTERDPTHRGWFYDSRTGSERLSALFNGTEVFDFDANDLAIAQNLTAAGTVAVTGASTLTGAVTATAGVTATGGGVTYGGRGAVTQATNHATGVTLSALNGIITLASVDLAAGVEATFVVTNTLVAVGDVVMCCVGTNNDASGEPFCFVSDVAAGSFDITLTNLHASTAAWNDASTINFVVIQSNA